MPYIQHIKSVYIGSRRLSTLYLEEGEYMSKRITLPGEPICKEEEYLAHKGVYVDENGVVRATTVGELVYDNANRRILVKPVKELKIPKAGEIVVGYVDSMRDDVAFIKIVGYDLTKTFKHSFTGVLHISQVVDTRGDTLYNYMRLGDLVKVKVLNSYIPILVTAKEPKLGVMLAFCSKCGSELYRDGHKLKCGVCGNTETRKTSLDYMKNRGKRNAKV